MVEMATTGLKQEAGVWFWLKAGACASDYPEAFQSVAGAAADLMRLCYILQTFHLSALTRILSPPPALLKLERPCSMKAISFLKRLNCVSIASCKGRLQSCLANSSVPLILCLKTSLSQSAAVGRECCAITLACCSTYARCTAESTKFSQVKISQILWHDGPKFSFHAVEKASQAMHKGDRTLIGSGWGICKKRKGGSAEL